MTTLTKSEPLCTRVLIVDDAADLRDLARAQLAKRPDLQVVGEAADGIEAVQRSTTLQPDLVLCDISMPRLDGIDAIPQIRRAAPQARILMLSSHNDDITLQRAMNAGADAYAIKGLPRHQLLDKIDLLMQRSTT